MLFRTSLKQTLRTPVRLIAYFLVAALVTAFLCVGLNLRISSEANLNAADTAFTTVAVPEFQALLDEKGQLYPSLSGAPDANYATCPAYGYDLTPIKNAMGVADLDVQGRFGACISGRDNIKTGTEIENAVKDDVIIFTVNGNKTITVSPLSSTKVPVTVTFSALGFLDGYQDAIELFSQIRPEVFLSVSPQEEDAPPIAEVQPLQEFEMGTEEKDGSFYLEPGKTYIMACSPMPAQEAMTQTITVYAVMLWEDLFHAASEIRYDGRKGWTETVNRHCTQKYLPIAPYEEGFFETERGAFFQEIIDAYRATASSLNAITTNDLAAMRPFHSGGVHVAQGRAFTEEEYAAGAKICLVSDYIAELNGWQLGDTLPLSFYETRYLFGSTYRCSVFRMPTTSFFDAGEYTIIGIYSGNVIRDYSGARAYTKGNGLDAKDVLLPTNSVANAPLPEISQYTTSIRLKNSEAQAFMAEMAVSGLMEEQPGGYELGLTVYDQGYSHVAPGLNQLARVSRLTLLLSAGAAGAAVLGLALLHVLRMRREIAAMRSLGTKKGQIVVLSLAGILLVCLLGACAGAYAGHMVSAEVAGRVLAGAEEAAVDTTFTAMMGEETAKEFTFTLESDPKLAVAAGGAAVVAFALLALLLLAAELRRPPMCLLAEKE